LKITRYINFLTILSQKLPNWLISEGEVCWTTVRVHTVTCSSSLQHTETCRPKWRRPTSGNRHMGGAHV